MRWTMTTISNNKLGLHWRCTKELLIFIKHVQVELIISLGKLVKGASPQGIGLASNPGSLSGEGKESLVHTVCACARFTEQFLV